MGKRDPPTQIQPPPPKNNLNHNNDNTQVQQLIKILNTPSTRELSEQIQLFPISKQRITIQHQMYHNHEQEEIIQPHQRNFFIPQTAIHPFFNNTIHNQTHRRSRRIIAKNLPQNNNTIITVPPTGPQDTFIEHHDCEIKEISNVKYYELKKICTYKFKPMELEMEKTMSTTTITSKSNRSKSICSRRYNQRIRTLVFTKH